MHTLAPGCRRGSKGLDGSARRRTRRSGISQLAQRAAERRRNAKVGVAARHNGTTDLSIARGQERVTPHTLRHSAAMALLRSGVDLSVIALWLGHESTETTQIYLHADMQLKERALAYSTPSGLAPDRFRPTDPLLAFLESL